ncbi:hypothetical protein ACSGPA_003633, partial [Acinetobacter baumannii]
MRYIIGVLCVTYLPIHAFAESLQDRTNTIIPSVPNLIDINVSNTKNDENKLSKDGTRLFLNVFVNSTTSNDLIAV